MHDATLEWLNIATPSMNMSITNRGAAPRLPREGYIIRKENIFN